MTEKREVRHSLIHEVGVISVNQTSGWKKELNILSWNDGPAKYDIRDWSSDRKHMSKGVTLTEKDMETLIGLYLAYNEKPEEQFVPGKTASEAPEIPEKHEAAGTQEASEIPETQGSPEMPEMAEAQEGTPAAKADAYAPF